MKTNVSTRTLNQSDLSYRIKIYSNKTSTSVLRKHLSDNHLEDWVNFCDQLKITIHGADAVKLATEYRSERDGHMASQQNDNPPPRGERVPFSKEAFLTALTDFIISDDIVCDYMTLMNFAL